ncbi:MAG: phytanoyl-CoA dioxygenase family protein [Bacteroidota bacterium]
MSSPVFYSEALQQQFDADGIVSVPLLSNAEMLSLLNFYETTSAGTTDRKFHSTMFSSDAAYRKKIDEGIRKIVMEKINRVVNYYRILFANFIVKEPSVDTRVGIHQDWNMTAPEITSINVWIPLVDINEQTGLFYALKGSHGTFRNIRYTPYEDNAYAELENYILDNSTSFEVKAGSALIYHGGLVHFSEPNRSNALRIAVGCAMIPEGAPNLHFYKRDKNKKHLEVYKVSEEFYHCFNFLDEPKGVLKIDEIEAYETLPVSNMFKG